MGSVVVRAGIVERLAAHTVPGPGECLDWTASVDGAGYGKVYYQGRLWSVPRLVLWLATGTLGEMALHTCDRFICVARQHLYWGSRQQNADDAVARGRIPRGDASWQRQHPELVRRGETFATKLSASQVGSIRERVAAGERQVDIAREFGVHPEHVGRIVRRVQWA